MFTKKENLSISYLSLKVWEERGINIKSHDKKILHFYRRNKWKGFRLTKMIRLKICLLGIFFFELFNIFF